MFHWATGIPFQANMHSGAYDDLTLWEQIDEGEQFTPAKKWLICFPIVLYVYCNLVPPLCSASITLTHSLQSVRNRFLLSTHYTHYEPVNFGINFAALLFVLTPKLPQVREAHPPSLSGRVRT
jgi:hypothetical protein